MKTIIEVLNEISKDAELDAHKLDGQPFNGKTTAENFGYIYASIKSLAEICIKQQNEIDILKFNAGTFGE